MSGWIKLEKGLESDPRVLRMARTLAKTCNATAFHPAQPVTLVCGALARLWIYADTHARMDDTLDMSADEIDEWVGVPGFCAVMPADWLVSLDDGRVELPQFQEHNGVESRKRAMTQKRVARHRTAASNAPALQPTQQRNAPALPDQTRPDQDQTIIGSARKRADATTKQTRGSRVSRDRTMTDAEAVYAAKLLPGVDPGELHAQFVDHHTARGSVMLDWTAAFRTWARNAVQFGYPVRKINGHAAPIWNCDRDLQLSSAAEAAAFRAAREDGKTFASAAEWQEFFRAQH